MSSAVVVGIARNPEERAQALDFIRTQYLHYFNTTPPEAEHLFCAWNGSEVVGTMGLDAGTATHPVQLQRMYRCPSLPLPATSESSVQFGRWVVTKWYVSGPLTYAACEYGLALGRHYGWCEHTTTVHRVAVRFGIQFHNVPGAELIMEEVAPTNRAFYQTGERMDLYLVRLEQVRIALRATVGRLVRSKLITLRV